MQTDVCSVSQMFFQDPVNFESAVKGSSIQSCQISQEATASEVVRVDYGTMCLDWVKAGPAMLYQGEMPSGCYTLSFVVECKTKGHSFNFETEFSSGYMGFFPPGAKLDATNPAGAINAILTVKEEVFRDAFEVFIPEVDQVLSGAGFGMKVGNSNQEHLKSLLGTIIEAVSLNEKQSVRESICSELGRFLLPAYLAALCEGIHQGGVKNPPRTLARYQKFCDSRDFIQRHVGEPFSVKDFCSLTRLSERGVENLFNDLAGCGPVAFLRLQRLQMVRRALLESDIKPGKIKELAFKAGFLHMGHFSRYYRSLFGESAGQTLASKRG